MSIVNPLTSSSYRYQVIAHMHDHFPYLYTVCEVANSVYIVYL